jgi:hypothetical protein
MSLELIETKDLIAELLSRFDHAIFAGLKVDEGIDKQYELRESKGNTRTCQGLAMGVMMKCEVHRAELAEPADGD